MKKSECKKLMDALAKAHSCSVDYRKSLMNKVTDEELKEAFNFSFRLSELLRDVGNIRLLELQ